MSRRDYRVHVLLGFAMLPIVGLSQLSAHLMGSSHREWLGSSPFGADTVVGFFVFVISVFCACTSFFVMRGALTFIRQSLGTPFSTLRATCKVALLGLVLSSVLLATPLALCTSRVRDARTLGDALTLHLACSDQLGVGPLLISSTGAVQLLRNVIGLSSNNATS